MSLSASLAEWLIAALLVTGAFFTLVGAIGLVRLPDVFMRLHAPTKASTLGLGSLLVASMLHAATQGRFGLAELLITLFVFLTAPVSANLMAQAALHGGLASRARLPDDVGGLQEAGPRTAAGLPRGRAGRRARRPT